MLADLDPLAWDPSTRSLIRGVLIAGSCLCTVVAAFLLDPLLPTLDQRRMSKRKAIECVALGVFLVVATAFMACGVYVGSRLTYGHFESLPGAPRGIRRSVGTIAGHLILGSLTYVMAWMLLRPRQIIKKA